MFFRLAPVFTYEKVFVESRLCPGRSDHHRGAPGAGRLYRADTGEPSVRLDSQKGRRWAEQPRGLGQAEPTTTKCIIIISNGSSPGRPQGRLHLRQTERHRR